MKTFEQTYSDALLNDVRPRLKNGANIPDTKMLVILVKAKFDKYITNTQYRDLLDGLMPTK